VTFDVPGERLRRTHIVNEPGATAPTVSYLSAPAGQLELALGYEPVLLELADIFADGFESGSTTAWSVTIP
jgi:hypothetical protein